MFRIFALGLDRRRDARWAMSGLCAAFALIAILYFWTVVPYHWSMPAGYTRPEWTLQFLELWCVALGASAIAGGSLLMALTYRDPRARVMDEEDDEENASS